MPEDLTGIAWIVSQADRMESPVDLLGGGGFIFFSRPGMRFLDAVRRSLTTAGSLERAAVAHLLRMGGADQVIACALGISRMPELDVVGSDALLPEDIAAGAIFHGAVIGPTEHGGLLRRHKCCDLRQRFAFRTHLLERVTLSEAAPR